MLWQAHLIADEKVCDVNSLQTAVSIGDLVKIREILAKAVLPPPANLSSAEANLFGLANFFTNDPETSVSLLSTVLRRPFGPYHLAAAKNVHWVLMASNSKGMKVAQDQIELAFRQSLSRSVHVKGSTVYDLTMQKRICNHEMYQRHRHPGQWAGVGVKRWKVQYFDLLKKSITNFLYRDINDWAEQMISASGNPSVCQDSSACESEWDISQGASGFDGHSVPEEGHSVMRLGSLTHIQFIVEDVLTQGIPGDLLEAGCYRGGNSVLMRALLEDDDSGQRIVWVADSFQGIPLPISEKGKRVDETRNWKSRYNVSQHFVESVFRRYGYLDQKTKFLPGFFNETLPSSGISHLAMIHIDVDAYDSTMDVLESMYPKLSVGGYVVIDDFHLNAVRTAITEYRSKHKIVEPILPVPSDYVFSCTANLTARKPGEPVPRHLDLVTPLSAAYWKRVE